MDQIINSFGIDWRLFAAEVVNFLIVLGILYFFVFRKIGTLLETRAHTIRDGVKNAEEAQQTLADAEAEKHNILKEAGEQATLEIKAAVETAKQREADIMDEANHKADEIVKNSHIKGEEMKQKVIDSSKEEIAKMIVLGTERVLREQ